MQFRNHKRKKNTVLLVASDAPDSDLKQLKLKPKLLWTIIIILSIMFGAMVGFFLYESKIWQAALDANKEKNAQIEVLQSEKTALEQELITQKTTYDDRVTQLEEEVKLLSNSLQEKVKSEEELASQLEKQITPTEFPLSGMASMEDREEDGELISIFHGSEGSNVVATAGGAVEAVNIDVEYGNNVWINHGNGYITIYRNAGEPKVKVGDDVVAGTTLFEVGPDNQKLGYQIMYNGEYIDPLEMLSING